MAHAAGRDAPILTVSVAAELAGMHPQTVRQYDRLGLVPAKRTRGGGRRYSLSDVDKLLEIQELSQKEGINLAGISRIFALQQENEQLRKQNTRLRKRAAELQEHVEQRQLLDQRVFAAGVDGDVVVFKRAQELREYRERMRAAAAQQAAALAAQQAAARQAAAQHAGYAEAESDHYSGRTQYPAVNAELVVWRPLPLRPIEEV